MSKSRTADIRGALILLLISSYLLTSFSHTATAIEIGDTVEVTVGKLFIREHTGLESVTKDASAGRGMRGTVFYGPVDNDGYTWWEIDYGVTTGWSAEGTNETEYLRGAEEARNCELKEFEDCSARIYSSGDKIVVNTPNSLYVRSTPGKGECNKKTAVDYLVEGEIISDECYSSDGMNWWKIEYDLGDGVKIDGWSAEPFIEEIEEDPAGSHVIEIFPDYTELAVSSPIDDFRISFDASGEGKKITGGANVEIKVDCGLLDFVRGTYEVGELTEGSVGVYLGSSGIGFKSAEDAHGKYCHMSAFLLDSEGNVIGSDHGTLRLTATGTVSYANDEGFTEISSNFEETKEKIIQYYSDPLLENVVLSSYMISYLEGNYYLQELDLRGSDWESRYQTYNNFVEENLLEIKNLLESDETVNSYLSGERKGDVTFLTEAILEKSGSDPDLCSYYKDSFERMLENRIHYEDMAGHYITGHEKDDSLIYDAYRGLLFLEDSEISTENDILRIDTRSSSFSTRKLNIAEALSFEYALDEKLSDALVVMDQLENDFNGYLNELSLQTDLNDPSNKETLDALEQLNDKIRSDRATLANQGLNKIQLDLYTQAGEIEKVFYVRKGYSERVSDAEPGLEKIMTVIFSGGFGKDIVDSAGGFDRVKEAASVLEEENKAYSRGNYAIQALNQMGISGRVIDDWINDRLTEAQKSQLVNQLLVKSGRSGYVRGESAEFEGLEADENGGLTGRAIISTGLNEYAAVDIGEQRIVFGFLEESREDAKKTYDSQAYGQDIRKMVGTDELQYNAGEYRTQERLRIETNLQKSAFGERIRALEMSGTGKVLNFIDDGLSPGAIAIGAATGGFGGTFFGSVTGLTGAGLGVAENIIIDAAAGMLLVSVGAEPAESPWMATGTAVGLGVATGIPRIISGITKSQALSTGRYIEALVDATGDTRIPGAIGDMTPRQIRNPDFVAGRLKSSGIPVDESLVSKTVSELELETAVEKMDANDLSSAGLVKTRPGELVDESGSVIRNLDELKRHMDNFRAKTATTIRVENLQEVKSLEEIDDFNEIKRFYEAKKVLEKNFAGGAEEIPYGWKYYDSLEKDFDSWYTGNYNPETGKITLYRYVDHYEGFDGIINGKSDLMPRGYVEYQTEDDLIFALEQRGNKEAADAIRDFNNGEDISGFMRKWRDQSAGGFNEDPTLYWTTKGSGYEFAGNREYRITIEYDPDKAFRAGGLDSEGKLVNFDHELEWTTIGPIKNENIVEISNLKTGEIFNPSQLLKVKSLEEIYDFNRIKDFRKAELEMTTQYIKKSNELHERIYIGRQRGLKPTQLEEELKDLEHFRNSFYDWYDGNYNPETGKITLYRYVDDYEGFDDIIDGKSDLLPRGYQRHGTEENLIKALREEGRTDLADAIESFNNGEDISDFIAAYHRKNLYQGGSSVGSPYLTGTDPALYWTTSEDISRPWLAKRKFRIRIELEPDEAFRAGKLDENGNLIGYDFEHLDDWDLEWTTIGPVRNEDIVEILDMRTSEVFVPSEIKKTTDNILLVKDEMLAMPAGYSYYAHGTNGKALEQILETDGMVLPGKDLRERGILISTGESGGTTALNKERISVISLDHFRTSDGVREGHVSNAIDYSERASKGFSKRPSNIDYKIMEMERVLSDFKKGDDTPVSWIESCEESLLGLRKLKAAFSEMSSEEISRYEKLSDIEVVVLGKSERNLEGFVRSDVDGEVSLPSLKVASIAVKREHISTVKNLLDAKGSTIKIIPMDKLENLQRLYLQDL